MERMKIFEVKEFDPAYVGIINELLSQLTSSPVSFTDTDLQTMIVSGSSHLFLTSSPARVAANQLYRSVGFEPKETNVYKMTFKK